MTDAAKILITSNGTKLPVSPDETGKPIALDVPIQSIGENKMIDLIERLEGLTGPCREADEAIADALFERSNFAQLKGAPIPTGCQMWWQDGQECSALRYTHSLYAAMTLVPDGCMWNVGGNPKGGFASAGLFGAAIWQGIDQIHGEAPTPAIALCIAALEAMTLPDTMQDGDRYE